MAAPAPPPANQLGAVTQRRKTLTVYLSPLCPELRTRAWIELVGFPRSLWFKFAVNGCLNQFGGLTHLDSAEFRRSGRTVVEARVTRVAVPRRVTIYESDVPGLPDRFLCHDVHLVIISAEPVFDEGDEDGQGKMNRFAMPPNAQAQAGESESSSSARIAAAEYGVSEVTGTEERPEFVKCFLSRKSRLWDR